MIRNVENLRWATRQNMEDTFRRFGSELDERLATSLDATRGAMRKALEQRKTHAERIDAEIDAKQTALSQLGHLRETLARHETAQLASPPAIEKTPMPALEQ